MKKIFLFILVSLFLVFPAVTHALDLGGDVLVKTADTAGYNPGSVTDDTFAQTIGMVIRIALSFMGVIFLVLMVYAGILWMTARGEEEPVKKAQKIITTSIIGLIIVVSAYSITNYFVPLVIKQGTGQTSILGLFGL